MASQQEKDNLKQEGLTFAVKVKTILDELGIRPSDYHIGTQAPDPSTNYLFWIDNSITNRPVIKVKSKTVENQWDSATGPIKMLFDNLAVNNIGYTIEQTENGNPVNRQMRSVVLRGSGIGTSTNIVLPVSVSSGMHSLHRYVDESLTTFKDKTSGKSYPLSVMINRHFTDFFIDGTSIQINTDGTDLSNWDYVITLNYAI